MKPALLMIRTMAIITGVMCAAGCCVVPWPHDTQHSSRFTGTVVAGDSHAPLAGATVLVVSFPRARTQTAAGGQFVVGPARQWRWGYLWTPPLTYDLPTRGRFTRSYAIEVSHPQYLSMTLSSEIQQRASGRTFPDIDFGQIVLQPKKESNNSWELTGRSARPVAPL